LVAKIESILKGSNTVRKKMQLFAKKIGQIATGFRDDYHGRDLAHARYRCQKAQLFISHS
jgi:hypothetical protein